MPGAISSPLSGRGNGDHPRWRELITWVDGKLSFQLDCKRRGSYPIRIAEKKVRSIYFPGCWRVTTRSTCLPSFATVAGWRVIYLGHILESQFGSLSIYSSPPNKEVQKKWLPNFNSWQVSVLFGSPNGKTEIHPSDNPWFERGMLRFAKSSPI